MPKNRVTNFGNSKEPWCSSQTNLRNIAYQGFGAFCQTLRLMFQDGNYSPPFPSILMSRSCLRSFGLWPLLDVQNSRFYRICNLIILSVLLIFVLSITSDLVEVRHNFALFGEDLVILLGLYLILVKICLFRQRVGSIDDILKRFEYLHYRFSQLPDENHEIRKLQRKFFFFEGISHITYQGIAISFAAALCLHPIFTEQSLPYRSKYPFSLQPGPIYALVYCYQCICTVYMLLMIIFIDTVGCHSFCQTAVNLKILSQRIRQLGEDGVRANMWIDLRSIVLDHQYIIGLIDRINSVFYSNYVIQMGASTFMICLTAFEALLAKDEPMVAFKFLVFMFSAIMQLFYWCWMGNMVYFDSLEVADAAYSIHDWFKESPRFQRNLMILIMRAQKPLVFQPRPFYAFEFQTLTSILSNSYSYFAILRTMND